MFGLQIRKIFILILLLFPTFLWAAAPTRTYTYTSGAVINPDEVTANEDNIFRYLQTGVDTFASGGIASDNITDGTIVNADISGSAAIGYSKLSLSDSIVNADINSSAGIVDTKLNTISTAGKVSGAALTSLTSIPSGAGEIPDANKGFPIVLTTDVSGTLPVGNGGTGATASANSANGVVVLNGSAQLPAVDGSLLTGISTTPGAGTITSTMLKTTTGEVSITETSSGSAAASALTTLPGGIYGFDTLYKAIQSAGTATTHYVCAIKGDINIAIAADGTLTLTKRTTANGPNESYTNKISLGFWKQYSSGSAVTLTYYAQQTYVTASGEDLWIFLLVNKTTKELISAWQAPDHPAYGNGGDLDKVHHPFLTYDETKQEIVLVDKETCSKIKIESEQTGKSILTLVNEEYSVITDSEEAYKPLHSGKFINKDNKYVKQMVEKIPNYIKVRKLNRK